MPIQHADVSTVPDQGVAGEIGPVEWNKAHNAQPFYVPYSVGTLSMPNQGSALSELPDGSSSLRVRRDLTYATEYRLIAGVITPGATGAVLRPQYLNVSSVWTHLGGGADLSIATVGVVDTGWRTIGAPARTDVLLRVAAVGGNGNVDPVLGTIAFEFR